MADRTYPSHDFHPNFTHNSLQQSHVPQPPPRSQQNDPRLGANQAPSEFEHRSVGPTWRDAPVRRDPSNHGQPNGNVANSYNHQTQGPVRGPVHPQHSQGRLGPVVQQDQQYIEPHVQHVNHPTSYNARVNHPQFPTRVPRAHMNGQQQTNPRAFNANTPMHEAGMNKQDGSHYRNRQSQEEIVQFRQPGYGAQHTPNKFTPTLQPSHDQSRAFPLPGVQPAGGIGRSTIPGNQPMGGLQRTMPTEFQEDRNYLRGGIPQSDDSTYMGSRPRTYASSTDPSVEQRITRRRAETDHRKGAHYGNPSSSNIPDILQQQLERLTISDMPQVTGSDSSTETYRLPTTMVSTEGTMREDARKARGRDLDRIHTEFSYDMDLFRYIARGGEYPVAGGGCADVFTGTLSIHQTATKVAIKAIKVYSADNNMSKKLQRLEREIGVWKKLNHDNVLQLLGTTSGFGRFPAMVCPWLENGTLTLYLERAGLQISRILMLIFEVASGLQYLHSKSIVHGDLSGSNVLIDADGKACIADFGLSTILYEGVSISVTTSTEKQRGTLRWAAPELLDLQDDGDAKNYTKSTTESDVYSFGSIMLQILNGKIPYHYYPRDMQVVTAISKGEVPRRPNDPCVTERRWMFIKRCWSPIWRVSQRPCSDEIVAFSKDDLVGKYTQAEATGIAHGSRYPTL